MKKITYLIFGALFLTGCASVQNTELNSTRGLLICAPSELCPIIKVQWDEQNKAALKVDVFLDNPKTYYDIQSIAFENGQKSHTFKPTAPTQQQYLANNYRSTASIDTPLNLMADLKGSDAISMKIVTDKGIITRYLFKDGQESSAFKQFVQAYPQQ